MENGGSTGHTQEGGCEDQEDTEGDPSQTKGRGSQSQSQQLVLVVQITVGVHVREV